MKAKNKTAHSSLSTCEKPLLQQKTINKRHHENKSQRNHLPLSSTPFVITQHDHGIANYLNMKNYAIRDPNRQSPYLQLPSLGSESKSLQMNTSKLSQRQYQQRNTHGLSNYNQMTKGKSFQIEQSRDLYYTDKFNQYENQQNTRRKLRNINNNFQSNFTEQYRANMSPRSQQQKNFVKRHNHNVESYVAQSHQHQNEFMLINQNKTEELIKKEIDNKLERVYEKIDQLSRSKEKDQRKFQKSRKNSKKQNQYNQANISISRISQGIYQHPTPKVSQSKLCYSNIVYESSTDTSFTPLQNISNYPSQQLLNHSLSQQYDNKIQHRINSPSKPSLTEIQQNRIIQLQRKVTMQGGKILKLEEQLLRERQKLIRKEKEWLLRENQLLSWIEENEKELQQFKIDTVDDVDSDQNTQLKNYIKQNVIICDNKSGRKPIRYTQYSNSKSNRKNYSSQKFKINKFVPHLNDEVKGNEIMFKLLNNVFGMIKMIQNWMMLMNRTHSEELPGTAFRVKEEMNLNRKFIKEIQTQCQKLLPSPQFAKLDHLSAFELQFKPPNQYPASFGGSQSDVFLLESYCPPTSQQYQVSTKRNSSNIKNSSRKSLCLSECKSTTNRKNNLHSTNKKNTKSKKNIQTKDQQRKIPIKCLNKNFQVSRKQECYLDEVFYDKIVMGFENRKQNCQDEIDRLGQLYYCMSVQAMALEELIYPSFNNTKESHQQNLLGEDSQLSDIQV